MFLQWKFDVIIPNISKKIQNRTILCCAVLRRPLETDESIVCGNWDVLEGCGSFSSICACNVMSWGIRDALGTGCTSGNQSEERRNSREMTCQDDHACPAPLQTE